VKESFDPQMAANGFWQFVLPERHVRRFPNFFSRRIHPREV
jgi:hypothetical protein